MAPSSRNRLTCALLRAGNRSARRVDPTSSAECPALPDAQSARAGARPRGRRGLPREEAVQPGARPGVGRRGLRPLEDAQDLCAAEVRRVQAPTDGQELLRGHGLPPVRQHRRAVRRLASDARRAAERGARAPGRHEGERARAPRRGGAVAPARGFGGAPKRGPIWGGLGSGPPDVRGNAGRFEVGHAEPSPLGLLGPSEF